jgi:hypothetical protein
LSDFAGKKNDRVAASTLVQRHSHPAVCPSRTPDRSTLTTNPDPVLPPKREQRQSADAGKPADIWNQPSRDRLAAWRITVRSATYSVSRADWQSALDLPAASTPQYVVRADQADHCRFPLQPRTGGWVIRPAPNSRAAGSPWHIDPWTGCAGISSIVAAGLRLGIAVPISPQAVVTQPPRRLNSRNSATPGAGLMAEVELLR